jgi:rSAM/selenodomain-associated transferase 2/rSAM/selenodomain-associated transferase 1
MVRLSREHRHMRDGAIIHVIIPALDEEVALPSVLGRIPTWVDQVIVVDNGSVDGTATVAQRAGATVVEEPQRGYGRACLAGIAASNDAADALVFLDADGSDFPEQMDRLVDPIIAGQADLVIGSRRLGSCAPRAMSLPQRVGNMLAPALIRLLWKQRYTDLGPFRAIRTAALRQLGMDDQTYGWTVQMQIRAARFGLRCTEAPVDYARRKGGRSKISGTIRGTVKAGAKILGCVAHEFLAPSIRHPYVKESLVVFARCPESGRVKTRLIPALGPDGAAALHADMLRHTITLVSQFKHERGLPVELRHSRGTPQDFAAFGVDGLPCRPQLDGDLGARMLHAFRIMLREASAAVIIGTDCPELSPGILHAAFEALKPGGAHDLVLGPATDGGYYLIGLRRPIPALFADMPWSTDQVLAETMRRASAHDLNTHLLPTLDDVDEPKDLSIWESVRDSVARGESPGGEGGRAPELSIIIPTLNEAERIANTLDCIRRPPGSGPPEVEIIVADGGSTDGTRRIAAAHGARVTIAPLPGAAGRGPQLNAGAALARSERLLFLHADTRLPSQYFDDVKKALDDDRVAIGAFRFQLDRFSPLLRLVEVAVRLRCAIFRTPYGDQALFMRAEAFRALGGFASIPLLEDVDIVRRARSLFRGRGGEVRILEQPAITSARRWAAAGVLRTTAVNQLCLLGYRLGISPHRLASWRARWTTDASRAQVKRILPVAVATPHAVDLETANTQHSTAPTTIR